MTRSSSFSAPQRHIPISVAAVLVGLLLVAPVVNAQATPYGTFVKVSKPGGSSYSNGIFFINGSIGYEVGGITFHRTSNAGRSWSYDTLWPQFSLGQLTTLWANQAGIVVVASTPEYSNQWSPVLRSTNFGATWVRVGSAVVNQYVINAIAKFGNRLIAVGNVSDTTRSRMFTSTDLGATWQYSSELEQFYGGFSRITVVDSLRAFLYGSNGRVVYSSNGGVSWVNRAIPSTTHFVRDMHVDKTNLDIVQAIANEFFSPATTRLYASTNGGLNWTLVWSVPVTDFLGMVTSQNVLGTFLGGGGYGFRTEVQLRMTGRSNAFPIFSDSLTGNSQITCKWIFGDGRIVYATAGNYFLNYYPPTTPVVLDNLGDTVRVRHNQQVVGMRSLYGLSNDSLTATTFTNASWLTRQIAPASPAESVSVTYDGIAQGFSNRDTSYVAVDTIRSRRDSVLVRRLVIYVQGTTSVERNDARPLEFALGQNYPNPFNPTTNFQFSIANSQSLLSKIESPDSGIF